MDMSMATGTRGRNLRLRLTMGNDHKPDPKVFVDNLKGPMHAGRYYT
jgi:hypothetical protein